MNEAVTKTISLLVIIMVGFLLNKKIKSREQRNGIKTIILSLALPATIFIALLKIEFDWTLIFVPILVLGFNYLMFLVIGKTPIRSLYTISNDQFRTLKLLIPSLAPGLSCFPFLLEYFGEESLAMAALADVGNKFFVLICLYIIAMNMYFHQHQLGRNKSGKIKGLLLSLLKEPINMVIAIALIMLALGINFTSLPAFMQMSIDRLSLMMTPLILLFIGISVKLSLSQIKKIFGFLFFRSAIAFLISTILLVLLPVNNHAMALLIVIFPQSACSFWPYAHMSLVNELEDKNQKGEKTFDLDFAMNVLACSLPFSTILILGICTFDDLLDQPMETFLFSGIFIAIALVPALFSTKIQSYAHRLMAAFK